MRTVKDEEIAKPILETGDTLIVFSYIICVKFNVFLEFIIDLLTKLDNYREFLEKKKI